MFFSGSFFDLLKNKYNLRTRMRLYVVCVFLMLALFPNPAMSAERVGCLDQNGNPVDWWFMRSFKIAADRQNDRVKSHVFAYFTSVCTVILYKILYKII